MKDNLRSTGDDDPAKLLELAIQIFAAENRRDPNLENSRSWGDGTMKRYLEKARASLVAAGRINEPPTIHAYEIFAGVGFPMTAAEMAGHFASVGWKGMVDTRTVDASIQRIISHAFDEIRKRRCVEEAGHQGLDHDYLRLHVEQAIGRLSEKVGLSLEPHSEAEACIRSLVSTLTTALMRQTDEAPPMPEEDGPDAVLRSLKGGCFARLLRNLGALPLQAQRSIALALEDRWSKWLAEEPSVPNGDIAGRVSLLADWLERLASTPKAAADHLRTCANLLKEGSASERPRAEATQEFMEAVRAINADWGNKSALEFLRTVVPEDLLLRLRQLSSRLKPQAIPDTTSTPAEDANSDLDILPHFRFLLESLAEAIKGNTIRTDSRPICPPPAQPANLSRRSDLQSLLMLFGLMSNITSIMSETESGIPGAIELEGDLLTAREQLQKHILRICRSEMSETSQHEYGIQLVDEILDPGPKSYIPCVLLRYAAKRGIERRRLVRNRSKLKSVSDT